MQQLNFKNFILYFDTNNDKIIIRTEKNELKISIKDQKITSNIKKINKINHHYFLNKYYNDEYSIEYIDSIFQSNFENEIQEKSNCFCISGYETDIKNDDFNDILEYESENISNISENDPEEPLKYVIKTEYTHNIPENDFEETMNNDTSIYTRNIPENVFEETMNNDTTIYTRNIPENDFKESLNKIDESIYNKTDYTIDISKNNININKFSNHTNMYNPSQISDDNIESDLKKYNDNIVIQKPVKKIDLYNFIPENDPLKIKKYTNDYEINYNNLVNWHNKIKENNMNKNINTDSDISTSPINKKKRKLKFETIVNYIKKDKIYNESVNLDEFKKFYEKNQYLNLKDYKNKYLELIKLN